MPDVCVSCFGGQILKQVIVLTILSTSAILVGYWNAIVKILRGAKSVASKIEFLGLSERVAVLARAKFLR